MSEGENITGVNCNCVLLFTYLLRSPLRDMQILHLKKESKKKKQIADPSVSQASRLPTYEAENDLLRVNDARLEKEYELRTRTHMHVPYVRTCNAEHINIAMVPGASKQRNVSLFSQV